MICVDNQQTYLLASWITDNGVALEISGPETIFLHEHKVTEINGNELIIKD